MLAEVYEETGEIRGRRLDPDNGAVHPSEGRGEIVDADPGGRGRVVEQSHRIAGG